MSADTDKYFAGYEDLEVHELMLRDQYRQQAYYKAIVENTEFFKSKVVLDVGAGTGILSAFCAKAGALLVYAVEASNLAEIALQVINDNELTSIVKVIHSKIEEFTLPSSAEKVDVIVSEWMGFFLLHEGMLDSVLFARDNFLKPNGRIFPNEATIYVAPCAVPSRFAHWDQVNGVRLNKFAAALRHQKSLKPEIAVVNPDDLLHEGVPLHWINLEEVQQNELQEISFKTVLAAQRTGKHQGFCIWFDCRFPAESYENGVVLSTSPNAPPTHWKQCIVVLPEAACDEVEEKAPIAFKIAMIRHPNEKRKYNLEVELLDPNCEEHPIPCDCHLTKCILTKVHLQALDMQ